MKPDTSPAAAPPSGSTPLQSVQTPTAVKWGAAVAIVLFFAFIAFYYFGPRSDDREGAASRPVGGNKVQAPLAPGSATGTN